MANVSKFFSAALEAADKLTQKSGTSEQMLKMLQKYGAKPSELDYIGLPKSSLAAQPKISKQELLDYIDKNQVKPEEVLYRGQMLGPSEESISNEIADALIRANSADSGEAERARKQFEDLTGVVWEPHWSEFENAISPEEIAQGVGTDDPRQERLWHEAQGLVRRTFMGSNHSATSYADYLSQPASAQYTEHLVTLPNSKEAVGKMTPYMSSHWDEPNVLAHMRYDYDPDALRLEEIQSDWLQQARKQGMKMSPEELEALKAQYEDLVDQARDITGAGTNYQYRSLPPDQLALLSKIEDKQKELLKIQSRNHSSVPRAPLANVNDWTGMMVRRALLDASQKDLPYLRWTPGAMQENRYSSNPGLLSYYDKILPNVVKKYIDPYGGKIEQLLDKKTLDEAKFWNMKEPENYAQGYWQAEIPPELARRLKAKGAVPFFKRGGAV